MKYLAHVMCAVLLVLLLFGNNNIGIAIDDKSISRLFSTLLVCVEWCGSTTSPWGVVSSARSIVGKLMASLRLCVSCMSLAHSEWCGSTASLWGVVSSARSIFGILMASLRLCLLCMSLVCSEWCGSTTSLWGAVSSARSIIGMLMAIWSLCVICISLGYSEWCGSTASLWGAVSSAISSSGTVISYDFFDEVSKLHLFQTTTQQVSAIIMFLFSLIRCKLNFLVSIMQKMMKASFEHCREISILLVRSISNEWILMTQSPDKYFHFM